MRVPGSFLVLLLVTSLRFAEAQSQASSTAEASWRKIPGSSMNSVFIRGVDDAFKQAPNSWTMIQKAWSGGVCVGQELFVWGGGHMDGAHNGLLAVNVISGRWRRMTEPSPIWTEKMCPKGVCSSVSGPCELGSCQTGPDGRPVARHTYSLLAADGEALYASGGGIWSRGADGDFKGSTWTFDIRAGQWFPLDTSPVAKNHGSLLAVNGRLYHMTTGGFATMDIDTGRWRKPTTRAGLGGLVGLVYVPTVNRFYALGNGSAWHVPLAKWGEKGQDIPKKPAVIQEKYLGLTYYPPDDLILIWNGGPTLTTLNPRTNQWGTFTPNGNPGPELTNGTMGRLSYCGGRVVLVNGVSQDLAYLDISGKVPLPPPVKPPPEPPVPPVDPPPPPPPPPPTAATAAAAAPIRE